MKSKFRLNTKHTYVVPHNATHTVKVPRMLRLHIDRDFELFKTLRRPVLYSELQSTGKITLTDTEYRKYINYVQFKKDWHNGIAVEYAKHNKKKWSIKQYHQARALQRYLNKLEK